MFFLKLTVFLYVFFIGISSFECTQVNKCSAGAKNDVDPDYLARRVAISDCDQQPCVIQKGTPFEIAVLFKPTAPVQELINTLRVNFLGSFSLPFLGVSGKNVCPKVTNPDGTPAPCPLKANKTYMLVQSLTIPGFTPNVKTLVRYTLQSNRQDVFCFEVNIIPK